MFPFDLTGPQFLFFYAALAVAAHVGFRTVTRRAETEAAPPRLNLSDPYEIAYLRGGKNEVLRIAAIAPVDRGLLEATNDQLRSATADGARYAKRPVERALLEKYRAAGKAKEMFDDPSLTAQCEPYRASLAKTKLVVDDEIRITRWRWLALFAGGLALVTTARLVQALAQGRSDIWFLVILTAIALFTLWRVSARARARHGDPRARRKLFRIRYAARTARRGATRAGRGPGGAAAMSSPPLETFLALLYTDGDARRRFLADPASAARSAGLDAGDVAALARIDRVGLEMAARSFAAKRAHHDAKKRGFRIAAR